MGLSIASCVLACLLATQLSTAVREGFCYTLMADKDDDMAPGGFNWSKDLTSITIDGDLLDPNIDLDNVVTAAPIYSRLRIAIFEHLIAVDNLADWIIHFGSVTSGPDGYENDSHVELSEHDGFGQMTHIPRKPGIKKSEAYMRASKIIKAFMPPDCPWRKDFERRDKSRPLIARFDNMDSV